MSEIQKYNPETEQKTEIEGLYDLSQTSPQEFARKWEEKAEGLHMDLSEIEDFFRSKLHGGEDIGYAGLSEMPEADKRMLYSLRGQGNELGIVFHNIADEVESNPEVNEDLWRFIREQDARAEEERGTPGTEGLLDSFDALPTESLTHTDSSGNTQGEPRSQSLESPVDVQSTPGWSQDEENLWVANLPPEKRKEYFLGQRKPQQDEIDEARRQALGVAVSKGEAEPVSNSEAAVHTRNESEPQSRMPEAPLDGNTMRTMYEKAHSNSAESRGDFAAASRSWSPAQRNQYDHYSASLQTQLANHERQADQAPQNPQEKPRKLRRLWDRLRPWGGKKTKER